MSKKLCYKHKATGCYISNISGLNDKPISKKYKFRYYVTIIKEIKKDFIVIKVHKDSAVYFKNQEYFDSLPDSIYIDIKNPDDFTTVKINVKEDLEIVEDPKMTIGSTVVLRGSYRGEDFMNFSNITVRNGGTEFHYIPMEWNYLHRCDTFI